LRLLGIRAIGHTLFSLVGIFVYSFYIPFGIIEQNIFITFGIHFCLNWGHGNWFFDVLCAKLVNGSALGDSQRDSVGSSNGSHSTKIEQQGTEAGSHSNRNSNSVSGRLSDHIRRLLLGLGSVHRVQPNPNVRDGRDGPGQDDVERGPGATISGGADDAQLPFMGVAPTGGTNSGRRPPPPSSHITRITDEELAVNAIDKQEV
jgi:hypothetical protein